MRITKLDPYTVDDARGKSKPSSSSHDKGLSILARKKLQLTMGGMMESGKIMDQQEEKGHYNGEYMENANDQQGYHANSSKKMINNGEFSLKQKQGFMDFLQHQIKNQQKQLSHTTKTKVKLPQISSNKQAQLFQDQQQLNLQPQIHKIQQITKNIALDSTAKQTSSVTKQNSIFINIKAVIPMQKTSSKKKDYSLRDLRILRKQFNSNNNENLNANEDCIMQRSQQPYQQNQRQHSRSRTGVTKKTYLQKSSDKESPQLKLSTAQKRRSQRNSLQKFPAGNRDKKAFSINQGKKKYATTYQQFCCFISSLNKIRLSPGPIVMYKAFVGKGNNSILIKNAIKNRFWWNIVAEKTSNAEVNFVWSQQRDAEFITELPCTIKVSANSQKQKQLQPGILKKLKYHLQSKQEKQPPITRQFTRYGFSKLLSEKQSLQNNFTPLYAQTLTPQSLPQPLDPQKLRIHNHFQSNWNLTNKKALFYNLKTYYELIKEDPFMYIPLTFHVKEPGDKAWKEFCKMYEERVRERQGETEAKDNKQKQKQKKKKSQGTKKQKPSLPLWIIKPGQNSNQGCGIQVSDSLQQIQQIVKQKTQTGKNRSSIIQRYLMPFLYNKRKFDIRCYMLATSIKGIVKGYWYEQGYIRTSSKEFTTKNLKNRMIHLTNDAVQKKSQDYGKYENGNKISFADFQKYLDNLVAEKGEKRLNFYKTVYPKMMRLARDALTAANLVLDAKNRQFTFQIFGLDFMIDQEFQTWLIQVNNNPCLQLSSPLLARIIPNMVENAFKLAIDPMFPPPLNIPKSKTLPSQLFQGNKFTLVFNSCDIEEGFLKGIKENKVDLDQIVEGEEEDDELMDDDQEEEKIEKVQKVENVYKKEKQVKKQKEQATEILPKDNMTNQASQQQTDLTQSQQS